MKHLIYTEKSYISFEKYESNDDMVVALVVAASLTTMVYALPEQQALAWGHGHGHGHGGGCGFGCGGCADFFGWGNCDGLGDGWDY